MSGTRGEYCVGDQITLADLFLLPAYNRAIRYGVDTTQWKNITEIHEKLNAMEFAEKSHCNNQIDAPKK